MVTKLGTPKQIAVKIKRLKKEITLLSKAKAAETKAVSALSKARTSMKSGKGRKAAKRKAPKRKSVKRRSPSKKRRR